MPTDTQAEKLIIDNQTSKWRTLRLEQCGHWLSGGTPSKANPKYWIGDIPWVSPKDMDQRFIFDAIDHVSKDGVENGSRLIPKDSILFVVRSMTLANRFQIAITRREVAFNQDLKAIICNADVHPDFLFYAIAARSNHILETLVDEASHGTKRLKTDAIGNLEIPLPPLSEQHAIAHILGSLDDKIELNRRMNATLEATARALFQSWFVDFDPVHAKSRGEQPLGLDEATAALFPSRFVDSELGLIPEGWQVEPTEKFCQSVRDGTHNSPKPQETGRYLITSRHIIGSEVDIANAYRISHDDFEEINRRSKVDQWDVLITMIGTVGESFLVREKPDYAIKNIGLFKSKDRVSGEWLHLYLNTSNTKQLIKSFQAGTTQAYISLGLLRQIPLSVPPTQILNAFGETIAPISDRITHNLIETRALAETRDALLPKLLSGEVRVGDVDNETDKLLS